MKQPSGVKVKIFDNSAFGYWLLAFGQKNQQQPQRFSFCDPLPIGFGFGIGFGSPKGHPWVTQASRKGLPSVEWYKWFCLQQKLKNGGWGTEIAVIAEIADIARNRKSKTHTTNHTDDTD
jgi:hypothetical protein